MSENSSLSFVPTEKLSTVKNEPKYSEKTESAPTQIIAVVPEKPTLQKISSTNVSRSKSPAQQSTRRSKETSHVIRTRCKQLGVSVFFQEHMTVRSLGFTSAISGEGKTFMARLTAEVMAEDNDFPVTLLECNWENPTLSSIYNLSSDPGLSDWLLGRYPLEAIRRKVTSNLTVIPAGDDTYNATRLLRILQQRGAHSVLTDPNEILIIDLPSTVTTAYGPFATQLADSLILVVRMGITPESFVTEACNYLKDSHVHGVICNQVVSRIPRWLQRIL